MPLERFTFKGKTNTEVRLTKGGQMVISSGAVRRFVCEGARADLLFETETGRIGIQFTPQGRYKITKNKFGAVQLSIAAFNNYYGVKLDGNKSCALKEENTNIGKVLFLKPLPRPGRRPASAVA